MRKAHRNSKTIIIRKMLSGVLLLYPFYFQAYVFDGKTGEKLLELGSPAHKGGIYGVTFSPNNSEVLTVSGDKTAKIFNAESGECVV